MKISITFDNGPEPEVTPHVLDALARHEVLATFFVIGNKARLRAGQGLLQRTFDAGHRIGNHTYTHSVPLGEVGDAQTAIAEIEQTQQVIDRFTGQNKLFRPFGREGRLGPHLLSQAAYDYLAARRYSCVLWNSIPREWEDPHGWVQRAIDDVQRQNWTVLVVHDLPTGAMARLGDFLARAIEIGAEFTTEFPVPCTPLWRGEAQWDMSHYVTASRP